MQRSMKSTRKKRPKYENGVIVCQLSCCPVPRKTSRPQTGVGLDPLNPFKDVCSACITLMLRHSVIHNSPPTDITMAVPGCICLYLSVPVSTWLYQAVPGSALFQITIRTFKPLNATGIMIGFMDLWMLVCWLFPKLWVKSQEPQILTGNTNSIFIWHS